MKPSDYTFSPTAVPPWDHQRETFRRFADDPYCALFFEQRCGKTRPATDITAYRFECGDIDGMLIIAWPEGVHRNWISEEIPKWLPKRIPRRSMIWRSGRHKTKEFKRDFGLLLNTKGLAILAVNAEAIVFDSCKRHIKEFFAARRGVALIVDECDWASTPGAERTEVVIAMSTWKVIKVKMLLGGTPATESPFQLWSQFEILQKNFFGYRTHQLFRHHFGEYEWEPAPVKVPLKIHGVVQRFKNGRVKLVDKVDPRTGEPVIAVDRRTGQPKMRPAKRLNHNTGAQFEAILRDDEGNPRYRNLDELYAKMAPHVMWVSRKDVSSAPEPIHSKYFYEMSAEQLRVYSELQEEFRAELRSGFVLEVPHALTRLLRYQQVLSNRMPPRTEGVICGDCDGNGCEACDGVGIVVEQIPGEVIDPDHDPRIDALRFVMRDPPPKFLVWCRFQHEVTLAFDTLQLMGHSPVRYDGLVNKEQRGENLREFRHGKADCMVGNSAVGGRGLPMDVADLAVFYSNYFSGRVREQVEARTEALFKQTATHVVDIVCEDSVDERLVKVLAAKKSVSEVMRKGSFEEWL